MGGVRGGGMGMRGGRGGMMGMPMNMGMGAMAMGMGMPQMGAMGLGGMCMNPETLLSNMIPYNIFQSMQRSQEPLLLWRQLSFFSRSSCG